MEKDIKKATIQELDEMIEILKKMKKDVRANKGIHKSAEHFVVREIDKVYYDVKSLDERLEYCFKGENDHETVMVCEL